MRRYLRKCLGTMPADFHETRSSILAAVLNTLDSIVSAVRAYDQLFVGMTNGPFMLLLKADDPQKFINYATTIPRHKVRISWSKMADKGRTWVIIPANCPTSYKLSFRLPQALYRWIFKKPNESIPRAVQAKVVHFQIIHIYYRSENRDNLFQLEFDPNSIASVS